MAEPTVFEMEIEGVVHPVEDRTARQAVGKLTTYSTAEQDTGKTWIDGRKIYRKSFKDKLPAVETDGTGATRTISSGMTNVQDIISIVGTASSQSREYTVGANAGWGDTIHYYFYIQWSISGVNIVCNRSIMSGWDANFTIEYTKTTD